MDKQHTYTVHVEWTGNLGAGASAYTAYSRNHELSAAGKPAVPCSSDPAFRGDPTRYNPEDLLVAALSQCHMLWYLHLCAVAKVVVTAYTDTPEGRMAEYPDGSGEFTEVELRPIVTITAESDPERARAIHDEVHRYCCLARSVNFPVMCRPSIQFAATA